MSRLMQGTDVTEKRAMGLRGLGVLAVVALVSGCNCGDGLGGGDGGTGGGKGSGGGSSTGGGTGGVGGGAGGGNTGTGGGQQMATDGGCGLSAVIRDFKDDHPDFEKFLGDDRGIVRDDLGMDKKPQYKPATTSSTTTGIANFNQWYRNTAGVNQALTVPLPLTNPSLNLFVFDSAAFFPADGLGFGNQGRNHNFHFTTEIHATFQYKGGEVFTFRGDDDVWIFVNNKLAIDLGGVHSVQSATINFDNMASQLGITVGNTYSFDAFHAERHTTASNFRIETSIACFVDVVIN